MLLRFSVKNHLSIRDAQELSLTASSLRDVESGLIECSVTPRGQVLPIALIYGANASGKSNVVDAIRWMRSVVLHSHSRGEPEGGVPRKTFALDPGCAKVPSTFEIDFALGDIRYHYGLKASDDAFVAEWLYAFPSGRRQMLFEREGQHFNFGRGLKGLNKVISALTRPNSLFVPAAVQNGHEALSKISGFFRSLRFDSRISVPGEFAALHLAEDDLDVRIIDFLSRIGTGVVGQRRREHKETEEVEAFQRELRSTVEKFLDSNSKIDLKDIPPHRVELAHRGSDGKTVFFDLDRESAGTRRLLFVLRAIFRALDEGVPLVVDELDASLHTQACEALLDLFSSPSTNPKGAQLIATTHDTNLLRSSVLRRDQIWFTEKDPNGTTHLYPLTDIHTRKHDNIERGYLQGRFGAVPFVGSAADLVAAG